MSQLTRLLLFLSLSLLSMAQVQAATSIIWQEDFESDGSADRYTVSEDCTNNGGDFFTRTDGSNIGSFYEVSGQNGSFYYAGMDTDGGDPCTRDTQTLTVSGIDISGQSGLNFKGLFAEDDDGTKQDWDADSLAFIEYRVDDGSWTKLLQFAAKDSQYNTEPGLDTNFDGIQDGQALTSTFTEYSAALEATGSQLDLRVTLQNLNDGDEDFAFDYLRVEAEDSSAGFDLQITEMWPGNENGSNLSADWFEITNKGSTDWVAGTDPDLYYDDESKDIEKATLIEGISQIAAGKSVIVVLGNAADVSSFKSIWSPDIDLTDVEVGYTDGSGLGGGGDAATLWVGTPVTDEQVAYESYPNAEVAPGQSYDVDLGAFSTVGNESQAVKTTAVNDENEAAVGSPGNQGPVVVNPNAPTLNFDPSTDDLIDGGADSLTVITGSVGTADASDPVRTLGVNLTVADNNDVANTSVTASSSDQSVVPDANIELTGSGTDTVNIKIQAAAVGTADITVEVTDGDGDNGKLVLSYAASELDAADSYFHVGTADASAAIAIDADYMLVADDENQALRLFSRAQSGFAHNSFDFTSSLGLEADDEVDLEGATRIENTLYWLGSHSNNKKGKDKPERERLFSTELTGTGDAASLSFGGYYAFLEDDLLAWDASNGHGLGANALGLADSAAAGLAPEVSNGFSMEGFSVAPNSTTTAYLGFRAPLMDTTSRTQALIVPVTNFTDILDVSGGTAGSATFGDPIQLDLGGLGIRSLECNVEGCLIIAGSADDSGEFVLYTWTGNAADKPELRSVSLSGKGSFEAIVALPDTDFIGAAGDAQTVQLLQDNGDTDWYADGTAAKDLAQSGWQKFQSNVVTLGAVSSNEGGDLFISEYIEGSGNNKALEFYNGAAAAINLADYTLERYNNGSSSPNQTINFADVLGESSLAAGGTMVLYNGSSASALQDAAAKATYAIASGIIAHNGDDVYALKKGDQIIDLFGMIGEDPGSAWSEGEYSTANKTLRRKSNISIGNPEGFSAADLQNLQNEWEVFEQDSFDDLGDFTPLTSNPEPSNQPSDFSAQANSSNAITTTWTDAATGEQAPTAYLILCSTTGTFTDPVDGTPQENATCADGSGAQNIGHGAGSSYQWTGLNASTQYFFKIFAYSNSEANIDYKLDAAPTANATTAAPPAPTLISAIQGTTDTSPMEDATTTIEAIVVGDFQDGDDDEGRNLRGFYVQEEDADADSDAASSEGLFVFEGGDFISDVKVGDQVRISGQVQEYFGETQLSATSIEVISSGNTLPTPASISLPTENTTLNQDGKHQPDLEAYEGMLVSFADTLTITEMYQLDRFNEIKLSQGGRLTHFTQNQTPDVAAYAAHLQAIGARTITYDDGLSQQNAPIGNLDGFGPTFNTASDLRMGDTIDSLSGVLSYQWAGNRVSGGTWRVRATTNGENSFTKVNQRPAAPDDVGGTLKVASFNVLNYFNTLDNNGSICGPSGDMNCRGADNQQEFDRQQQKLVTALLELDADVIGLMELENDYTAGTASSVASLVMALNNIAGANTYDYIVPQDEVGNVTDVGSDAIAVGLIYKPAKVQPAPDSTAPVLEDSVLPSLGLSGPIFSGVSTNRAPLAASFEEVASGEQFTVAVTHMKSKGGSGSGDNADQNDGAGNWNQRRLEGVQALHAWLQTQPTGIDDPDVLILGDLNAYAKEDPIASLEANGYTNLIQQFTQGQAARSAQPAGFVGPPIARRFVFDAQVGTLDYAFANAALLAQVTGAAEWHINADEADAIDYNTDFGRDVNMFDGTVPYRSSDHDPLIVGLSLDSAVPETPVVTSPPNTNDTTPTITGTGEPNATITIQDSTGTTLCETAVNAEGQWSCELQEPIAVGESELAVFQTDNQGNKSEVGAVQVIVYNAQDVDPISDAEEQGPNGTEANYDGNGDGTPDKNQSHVLSMFVNGGASYITVVLEQAYDARNTKVASIANPSSSDAPEGYTFPIGFLDIDVPVDAAGHAIVMLYLPEGINPSSYYKHTPTPSNATAHWYEFLNDGTTGAAIAGNVITLHFQDGQRGDEDLTENGQIDDPGAPVVPVTTPPPPTGSGAKNIPIFSPFGLVLMVMGLLWFGFRKQDKQ